MSRRASGHGQSSPLFAALICSTPSPPLAPHTHPRACAIHPWLPCKEASRACSSHGPFARPLCLAPGTRAERHNARNLSSPFSLATLTLPLFRAARRQGHAYRHLLHPLERRGCGRSHAHFPSLRCIHASCNKPATGVTKESCSLTSTLASGQAQGGHQERPRRQVRRQRRQHHRV